MGFSRQEYWSELPCPPAGELPRPGIEPVSVTSPALAAGFCTTNTTGEVPSNGTRSKSTHEEVTKTEARYTEGLGGLKAKEVLYTGVMNQGGLTFGDKTFILLTDMTKNRKPENGPSTKKSTTANSALMSLKTCHHYDSYYETKAG